MSSISADTEHEAGAVARMGVDTLVNRVLREQHGPDAIAQRPIESGFRTMVDRPADYRQGILAARMVQSAASNLVNRYARDARGEGLSWLDLSAVLGVAEEEDDPAAKAFELMAPRPSRPFDEVSVSWRCSSCDKYVRDVGPYNGHPGDCERNHAENCARHLAEIREYEREVNL